MCGRRGSALLFGLCVAALTCLLPSAVSAAEPPAQAACRLPRHRGRPCPSAVRPALRWFLDEEQGDCVSFWFAGCDGNANNFATASACRRVCVEPGGRAACLLPAGRGPCTDSRLLWTFDADSQQCVTFVYGGCYGTANRFFTRRQCERACAPSAVGGGAAVADCLPRPGLSGP